MECAIVLGKRGFRRVHLVEAESEIGADAVFDGHRLAREVDSADAARPLPRKRERAIV